MSKSNVPTFFYFTSFFPQLITTSFALFQYESMWILFELCLFFCLKIPPESIHWCRCYKSRRFELWKLILCVLHCYCIVLLLYDNWFLAYVTAGSINGNSDCYFFYIVVFIAWKDKGVKCYPEGNFRINKILYCYFKKYVYCNVS